MLLQTKHFRMAGAFVVTVIIGSFATGCSEDCGAVLYRYGGEFTVQVQGMPAGDYVVSGCSEVPCTPMVLEKAGGLWVLKQARPPENGSPTQAKIEVKDSASQRIVFNKVLDISYDRKSDVCHSDPGTPRPIVVKLEDQPL
jgi:hypothetical protein